MTDQEKLLAIAQALITRTKAALQAWKETAIETRFHTSLEDTTISIQALPGNVDKYVISVINKNGRAVEELRAREDQQEGKPLMELYQLARRQALRVDETLDSLLRRLSR